MRVLTAVSPSSSPASRGVASAALVVAALVLAACGATAEESTPFSIPPTSSPTTTIDPSLRLAESTAEAFTGCMADNGVEVDGVDVVKRGSGLGSSYTVFAGRALSSLDAAEPTTRHALEECRGLLGLAPEINVLLSESEPEYLYILFLECLGDQGLSVGEPTYSEFLAGSTGWFFEDVSDDEQMAALADPEFPDRVMQAAAQTLGVDGTDVAQTEAIRLCGRGLHPANLLFNIAFDG